MPQILDSKKFSLERALEVDQRFLETASSSDDEGGAPAARDQHAAAAEGAQQPREDASGTAAAAAGSSEGPARPDKRTAAELDDGVRAGLLVLVCTSCAMLPDCAVSFCLDTVSVLTV